MRRTVGIEVRFTITARKYQFVPGIALANDQGQPIWVSAGTLSEKRVFSWVGVAVQNTPSP